MIVMIQLDGNESRGVLSRRNIDRDPVLAVFQVTSNRVFDTGTRQTMDCCS